MKLEIDSPPFVPSLSFRLTSTQWRSIQWRASMTANFKCSICDKQEELTCHEIWEADDERYILILKGVIALCSKCNDIRHGDLIRDPIETKDLTSPQLYRANLAGQRVKELEEYFMEVNKIDKGVMLAELERVSKIRKERLQYKWVFNYNILDELLANGVSGKEFCKAIDNYMGFRPRLFTHSMKCCRCGAMKGTAQVYYWKRVLAAKHCGISEEDMRKNYVCQKCRTKEQLERDTLVINNLNSERASLTNSN